MDNLLEQNIFDDDFVVFNNDIPYDEFQPEIDFIKKRFKIVRK